MPQTIMCILAFQGVQDSVHVWLDEEHDLIFILTKACEIG